MVPGDLVVSVLGDICGDLCADGGLFSTPAGHSWEKFEDTQVSKSKNLMLAAKQNENATVCAADAAIAGVPQWTALGDSGNGYVGTLKWGVGSYKGVRWAIKMEPLERSECFCVCVCMAAIMVLAAVTEFVVSIEKPGVGI